MPSVTNAASYKGQVAGDEKNMFISEDDATHPEIDHYTVSHLAPWRHCCISSVDVLRKEQVENSNAHKRLLTHEYRSTKLTAI